LLLQLLGALAIASVAGALSFLLWKARRLRRLHEKVLAERGPPDEPGAEPIFSSRAALFHGTRFEGGAPFLAPALREPCVGDLWVTAAGLFLRREPDPAGRTALLSWSHAWVEEAALVRTFAPLAGKELPALRLTFVRGGERLVSELSLKGGMEQLEKLRRELHLRQGRGSVLQQLQRFVEEAQRFGPSGGAGSGGVA
jgi:hypothetical protein